MMWFLADLAKFPLRSIDRVAALPFARVLNYYLPFHIGFVGAGCWLVFAVAATLGG
jgi:hypothetical protein